MVGKTIMVLNDLADSFCHSQKNAGLKGLNRYMFARLATNNEAFCRPINERLVRSGSRRGVLRYCRRRNQFAVICDED